MEVFTIGFAKRSAIEFFGALKRAGVRRVLDVRLNNSSQLAGYTKRSDLPFFLEEICGADYLHKPLLAPTQAILDDYKKNKGSWLTFQRRFRELMTERRVEEEIDPGVFSVPTSLLCSETTAEHCHRRLVLEYLQEKWGDLSIVHL